MRICLLAFGGALATLGCSGSSDDDYKFGAAELQQAVIGTWSGTWGRIDSDAGACDACDADGGSGEGGTGAVPFTLRIDHSIQLGAHPLCDPRRINSHPLCISTTEMPVQATLDVSDGSFSNVPLNGVVRVPGAELREADLSLTGASDDVAIVAQWILGKWLFCVANHTTGQRLTWCTIDSVVP